jgi:hypothetical protein
VLGHTPSGSVDEAVNSVQFTFDHVMDGTSFDPADDIVSFTGPDGDVTVTGFSWPSPRVLQVSSDELGAAGDYELVLGIDILDVAGNPLVEIDNEVQPEPVDFYVATFSVTAPQILTHAPEGMFQPPVSAVQLTFDREMDQTSFDPGTDVLSFIGPSGAVSPTDGSWVDARTLEISFGEQAELGDYELVLSSQVLDVSGNALDQDRDGMPGELIEDDYTVAFALSNIRNVSGSVTENDTWTSLIVADGTVTVEDGVTLTIDPGTVVKFADSSRLQVRGNLVVPGTLEDRVHFTSLRDDTVGGDTNDDADATIPTPGIWQGLSFGSGSATGNLQNVEIRYADKAIHGTAQGAQVDISNGVLRDGRQGVYVYTPYVEVRAFNLLISDNDYAGIFTRADSRHVFRNCTVVGNGFEGSGWTGAGIHLGGANLTLENCIVAFNKNGLDHSGDPPELTIRHSLFHNPTGAEIIWDGDPGEPDLASEGNTTLAPLFVDREAGNYELGQGSPAIDSAWGSSAPPTDIIGRNRADDLGMPNEGKGYPAYVDMGAYERQDDTFSADLDVVYVGGLDPEFATAGESISVEWRVANAGNTDVVGTWVDKLYLSTDPFVGPTDMVLATRFQDGPLPAGEDYTETITFAAPETSGPYYVLLQTNAEETAAEAVQTNNVAASPRALAVDVPLIELGTPALGTGLAVGEWDFYRFEAEGSGSVHFTLDAEATVGQVEIYVKEKLRPSVAAWDARGAAYNQVDQDMRLLDPSVGTHYVGVYARHLSGGVADYTLLAEPTALSITGVSPSLVGNAGPATLAIDGDDFAAEDTVHIEADDGTHVPAAYIQVENPTEMFATFDLAGYVPGLYDVVLVRPETGQIALENALTVQEGGRGDFTKSLSVPDRARPGRYVDVGIEYTNTGLVDMASPILSLVGDTGAQGFSTMAEDAASEGSVRWRLPGGETEIDQDELKFLALSSAGPAGVLRPGQ